MSNVADAGTEPRPAARGPRERRQSILDLVIERGHVSVDELIAELGVSPATVRRDLDVLASDQLVIRSRGGVSAHQGAISLPLRYRSGKNARAKEAIARAAVDLAAPGQVIGLNGGTTTTALAHELGVREDFQSAARPTTLVTNAINIAQDLAVRRHLQLVVTGGVVRDQSFELVGTWAQQLLEQISIDVLFLGANAISAAHGIATHDEAEAAMSARMAERAQRVVVVADSSKLGQRSFARIVPLSGIDVLITDDGADPDALRHLRGGGLDIRVAGASS
ncbi:MAG: DeoR/GlpR family DNA-binding transcription regulator [Brachybacterium sp.]|nr:DeoR/GlpR family DNA-binding transcription regulator [Brachybacterium sp.]